MTQVSNIKTDAPATILSTPKEINVTDSLGRVIMLRKPKPLDRLDFAKAASPDGRVNQLYLAAVAHLQFVAAIDGDPVLTPATDAELRALYDRLGDDGNEAAQTGVMANFADPKSVEAAKEALKNG
ncbi:MAG TPA: hypothetical protein VF503_12180 [Sphingobium sp.]|uniref:hypothetical protein n=1 Tax=Sphingobium sp. TaxID=1912891 RepID=UPI002ED2B099